jgi:hypothetical protein
MREIFLEVAIRIYPCTSGLIEGLLLDKKVVQVPLSAKVGMMQVSMIDPVSSIQRAECPANATLGGNLNCMLSSI